jgi:hypothetical protein
VDAKFLSQSLAVAITTHAPVQVGKNFVVVDRVKMDAHDLAPAPALYRRQMVVDQPQANEQFTYEPSIVRVCLIAVRDGLLDSDQFFLAFCAIHISPSYLPTYVFGESRRAWKDRQIRTRTGLRVAFASI